MFGLAIGLLVALPLGIVAGMNKGKAIDVFAEFFAIVGQSMSTVWLALLLVIIFCVKLDWLPTTGSDTFASWILPGICMSFSFMANCTRMLRSGMVEVLEEDFITATRARGVSAFHVNAKYGYIFDLGQGYEIELINIPGHQPGHAGYLDRQGRFLIGGDAFPTGGLTGGRDASTDERHAKDKFQWSWLTAYDSMRKCTTYRDALMRLSKRLGDFDQIYCGHGVQGHSSKLVLDLIAACNRIIADPNDFDEKRGDQYLVKIGDTGYMMPYYDNGV